MRPSSHARRPRGVGVAVGWTRRAHARCAPWRRVAAPRSYLKHGALRRLPSGNYSLDWRDVQVRGRDVCLGTRCSLVRTPLRLRPHATLRATPPRHTSALAPTRRALQELRSKTATKNRSLELSALALFGGKLFTMCDYTGIMYRFRRRVPRAQTSPLHRPAAEPCWSPCRSRPAALGHVSPAPPRTRTPICRVARRILPDGTAVPRLVLTDGPGSSPKGMKASGLRGRGGRALGGREARVRQRRATGGEEGWP